MQRRTVIEQPNAKLQEPPAEDLHVIGATERAAIDDSAIVAGKRVTPFSQPAELHMRLVDHPLDPIGPCKPEASREPALDHRGAGSLQTAATSMTAVLAAAVAPLVPTRPLSTRITLRAASIAAIAAQQPAGPPPTTRTSATKSSRQSRFARSLAVLSVEHEVDFDERIAAELGDADSRP